MCTPYPVKVKVPFDCGSEHVAVFSIFYVAEAEINFKNYAQNYFINNLIF